MDDRALLTMFAGFLSKYDLTRYGTAPDQWLAAVDEFLRSADEPHYASVVAVADDSALDPATFDEQTMGELPPQRCGYAYHVWREGRQRCACGETTAPFSAAGVDAQPPSLYTPADATVAPLTPHTSRLPMPAAAKDRAGQCGVTGCTVDHEAYAAERKRAAGARPFTLPSPLRVVPAAGEFDKLMALCEGAQQAGFFGRVAIREAAEAVRQVIGPIMPCCGAYAWQHRKVELLAAPLGDRNTEVLCPFTGRYVAATVDYLAWSEGQEASR